MINNSKAIWSSIKVYKVKNLEGYINSPSDKKIDYLEFIAEYANCKKIKKAVQINE